jgi:hypothetical protein
MFEQTVAIELEKRARLREYSLKLCVREAFVLVFPAVERHYSMREREKEVKDFRQILKYSTRRIKSSCPASLRLPP